MSSETIVDGRGVLSFGLLGELRVDLDGRGLDPGPRLQRTLLAVLLVSPGRVVAVDRLVELLWGDEPPAAATASLQAYVSQLRRKLEPDRPPRAPARILVTQDPGYALKVDPEQVDAWKFLALAGEAHDLLSASRAAEAAERLEVALEWWRGEALAEFSTEPWAIGVATRLAEAHDLALEDRVDAWLALGRATQAAAVLEQMVQDRPLRERRWAQLIVATYRSGRQADALRAYQRCRTVLAENLGIEPGPAVRRLESAVLAQDATLEWRPAEPPRTRIDRETGPLTGPGARRPLTGGEGRPPLTAGGDGVPGLTGSEGRRPLTEGPLASVVARDVQLDRLGERIHQTHERRGGAVVLVGEPGVGKTTLAEQAAQRAGADGAVVAWSRCLDAAAAPAYWPWIQLLREVPDGPGVTAARQRLCGEAGPVGEGGAAAFHAYEIVLAALKEVTSKATLVAFIDDLHAADEPSLALFQLLAGDLHRLGVLIIATLRDTEPSYALERALGDLLRHRGVERLSVPSLLPAEVERLAARTIGQQPDADVTTALFERTGGNLFYLTELLRLLGSEHRSQPPTAATVTMLDVPSGIRDVVHRRVQRLPDNTQALLTLSAVAGRDIDPDLLERAADVDSEELMLALEPAVAGGILATSDTGWDYRFRHPLIHESIYARIGRVERARLHARVATALESLADVDTSRLAQLAHHYLRAGPVGEPAKAVRYGREAAGAAMRQGAWTEARRHLEQALAAITAAVPDAEGTRCDVLIELGQARRAAGLVRESHQALEEAIQIADALGDEDRVLTAAVGFGTVALWASRGWGERDPRIVAILERQLARLGDHDDDRKVRILATLASELFFDESPSGWDYANQALDLAKRVGDPRALGIAASAYLLSALVNDHLAPRATVIEELLNDPRWKLGADIEAVLRTNLLTERLRSGDVAVFDAEIARVRELATDVLHSTELESQLHFMEASRDLIVGNAAGASEASDRGFRLMLPVSSMWAEPAATVSKTNLMLISGTLADHAEELADLAVNPPHPSVPHIAAPAAALAFAERGDDERARQLARSWFAPPPRAWTWMQPVAYWAQVAIRVGEPDPEWLYRRLLPHAGELAVVGTAADCGGAIDSLLAGLALRLGRDEAALEHAHAGLALERRAGARTWIPRTAALVEQAGGILAAGPADP